MASLNTKWSKRHKFTNNTLRTNPYQEWPCLRIYFYTKTLNFFTFSSQNLLSVEKTPFFFDIQTKTPL